MKSDTLSTRALHFFRPVLFPVVVCCALYVAAPSLSTAQAIAPVTASQTAPRVTIAASVHPLAKSAQDVGAVDPGTTMQRMVLVLGPSEETEHQLRAFLDSQQTKGSADYHHWLTPEEFGTRFGPAPDDIQRATSWLQQQGLNVEKVARSGRWVEFSGATAQVESAFQTQMRHYRVRGQLHTANATPVSIPAELAPVVRGVLSLHDFASKPMLTNHYNVQRDSAGVFVPVQPEFTGQNLNGPAHFLTPGDYANIYSIAPLYQAGLDGTGQTIAIVARSNIDLADVEVFRQAFSLPFNDPNVILSGPDPGDIGENDAVEATLDTEWAGAVAPRATIDLVITATTTTTDGMALSAAYVIDNNLAGIMDVSYAQCEQSLGTAGNAFFNSLWQQAAAQGISVFVSTGDDGEAGCDNPSAGLVAQNGIAINGIASTPFDTAVGGTEFVENGNDAIFWSDINGAGFSSAIGYIPEEVWNESCDPTVSTTCSNNAFSLFAGSGGVSTVYTKPSWQAGSAVPADGQRDIPDVSLTAAGEHDGYLFCFAGNCLISADGNTIDEAGVVGGTSASAPSFAGIMALVDQKTGTRQGLANYVLYPLAAKENFSTCNSSTRTNPATASQCVFNDITAGNNSVPGQTGQNAAVGFDLVTGLGSVNAANLVNAWSSVGFVGSATSLALVSAPVQHGQPAQLTVNVAGTSGSGVPSGNFSLISDKYGAVGNGTLTNGSFNGSFTSLPGGQYNLAAHYEGDGTFGGSDSSGVPVNIGKENSSIALSALTNSSTGPVTITSIPYGTFMYLHSAITSASGNGAATGTVTYFEGSNSLGTVTLNSEGEGELVSGSDPAFGAVTTLPVGVHNITASYSGDNSLNASSTSQPVSITVTKADPTVSFLNLTPVNLSSTEQIALIAFVSGDGPILPTGTLQFTDNGNPIGSPVPITPGLFASRPQGSTQVSLALGSHVISANYSGDAVYNSALIPSLQTLSVNVTAGSGAATQTSLASGSSSAKVGDVVTYTVSVTSSSSSSPKPSGTIQLLEPGIGSQTGAVPLQNGTATIPFQWPLSGADTMVAQYSGDANYAASASAPITVSVAKAAASISLTSSAQTVNSGNQVSVSAIVTTAVRPIAGGLFGLSGDVQFFDSLNGGTAQAIGAPVVLVPLTPDPANGSVGFSEIAALPFVLQNGTHAITAQYLGDQNYSAATSGSVNVLVGVRVGSQTTLSVDANSPAFGQSINFSAHVTSTPPTSVATGTIQFLDPNTGVLGTAPLQNGVATLSLPWNIGGVQSVFAEYSGDNTFASSASNPVTITLPSFSLTASANQLGIPAGVNAAVSLSLTPIAGLHSTVVMSCGSTVPAGSTCTFSPSSVTLDGKTSSSTTFILTTTAPSANVRAIRQARTETFWGLSAATGFLALAFVVLPGTKTKSRFLGMLVLVSFLSGGLTSCGGGGSSIGSGGGSGNGGGGGGNGGGGGSSAVATTTVISSSAIKNPSGGAVTFTASVTSTASTLTGNVLFFDGSTMIGQAAVANNQAALSTSSLSVGTHSITAKYAGDTQNAASISNALSQVITGNTQLDVTASSGGQSRTITMNILIE